MECESDSAVLWEHRFEDLKQWKAKHGDCNVPKAEGKLGRWVVRQRELHKKSKLEPERRLKLDRLGFVWNTNEAAWEHRYALLIKWGQLNGHCCVPISDPTLGMWVAKMRANRRRDKLAQHRIDKLDAINFVWNTAETDWQEKYKRLLDFRDKNGHSCVPFNEGELGWWVNTQRQNKRKGKLPQHRETLLDEADFVWNPQEFLAARRRQQANARATGIQSLSSIPDQSVPSSMSVYGHDIVHTPSIFGPSPMQTSVATAFPQQPSNSGRAASPQKRRINAYLQSNGSEDASTDNAVVRGNFSPTGKRAKRIFGQPHLRHGQRWNANTPVCSPVSNSGPSDQPHTAWSMFQSSNSMSYPRTSAPAIEDRQRFDEPSRHEKQSTTGNLDTFRKPSPTLRQRELRSNVQSIASLLSPFPPSGTPNSSLASKTGTTFPDMGKPGDNSSTSIGVLSSICGIPRIRSSRGRPSPTVHDVDHALPVQQLILPPISALCSSSRTEPPGSKISS